MRSPWRCPAPWLSARPSPRNRAGRTGPWWSRWWRAWCAEARGSRARRAAAAHAGRVDVRFRFRNGGVNVSEARHASPEAVGGGIACVEVLEESAPRWRNSSRLCSIPPRARGPRGRRPATAARARVLAARLRAVAESAPRSANRTFAKVARPSRRSRRTRRRARRWNRRLSCSRTRNQAARFRALGRRRHAGLARPRRRRRRRRTAVLRRRRDAGAATRPAPPRRGAAARTRTTRLSQWTTRQSTNRHRHPHFAFAPTPRPARATVLDRGVAVAPDARVARARSRCRPPPPSNESGAAGSAGLAGTLQVGTHGRGVRGRHRGTHRRALRAAARRRRPRQRATSSESPGGATAATRSRPWLETQGTSARRVARGVRRRREDAGDGGSARPRVRASRYARS